MRRFDVSERLFCARRVPLSRFGGEEWERWRGGEYIGHMEFENDGMMLLVVNQHYSLVFISEIISFAFSSLTTVVLVSAQVRDLSAVTAATEATSAK